MPDNNCRNKQEILLNAFINKALQLIKKINNLVSKCTKNGNKQKSI
jgi:hypothetical protein